MNISLPIQAQCSSHQAHLVFYAKDMDAEKVLASSQTQVVLNLW